MRKSAIVAAVFGVLGVQPVCGQAPPHAAPGWPPTSATGTLIADYVGVARGLTVMTLHTEFTLRPDGYTARVGFRTAGMFGFLLHADNVTTVTGRFVGDTVHPISVDSIGSMRGQHRQTRLSYPKGDPVVDSLTPAVDEERAAVPANLTPGTVDNLSAIALLIRVVGGHGRCDGSVASFDGRRAANLSAHTVGRETLATNRRTSFAGAALRCDYVSRQTAGFVKSQAEDDLRKPRLGSIWLAQLAAGAPPVPVRMDFENRLAGQVTLYLTGAHGGGLTAVPPCCVAVDAQGG